jgi:hypothetical protein
MWGETPTTAQIETDYALTAMIDPAFAARDRAWWQSRTLLQLQIQRGYAYNLSNGELYGKINYYIDRLLAC